MMDGAPNGMSAKKVGGGKKIKIKIPLTLS
jgi:hypothetical protein